MKKYLYISVVLFQIHSLSGVDWLQFQYNSENHGRAPKAVRPPYRARWIWYGEDNSVFVGKKVSMGQVPRPVKDTVGLLSFTMSAVVADGQVIFGDLNGKVYCLAESDGKQIWKTQLPGALIYCLGIYKQNDEASNNIIVAPCQDGKIYGLSWKGKVLWNIKARKPFVTPPKIVNGIAYAGSLDGNMYAVDIASGKLLWKTDVGAPIRQPCAIAKEKVFFGSEDMIFHALNAKNGKEIWKSKKGQMKGQSFRNTWPVVVDDKVITFQIIMDGHAEFIMESLLWHAAGDIRTRTVKEWPKERDAILKWLKGDTTYAYVTTKPWQKNPGKKEGKIRPNMAGSQFKKTCFVFNVDGDGKGNAVEPYQVPMGIVGGTGNSNMGPTLDAQGRPLLWWRVSISTIITGSGFGTGFSPDLSAMDTKTGDRIPLPTTRDIYTKRSKGGRQSCGGPGMELDNHHMITSAEDMIYYFNPFRQCRWMRMGKKGVKTGKTSAVYLRHDGGGNAADVVFYPLKKKSGERQHSMFDSHGAARTPAVIANGGIYCNELDARAFACYETDGGK